MERAAIFEGLNAEQRRAVEATRGPVCILAGAGSGKTTTITRRVAHQVASGAFPAGAILAVTFTDKAAGEMRARLGALGAGDVRARTFHSAALAQLRRFAPEQVGPIVASKVVPLRRLANALPPPHRFRPAADLATEIEWAKNRRIPPERYSDALAGRRPPIPAWLMERVYRDYERWKSAQGALDFEDLLERAIRLLEDDEHALAEVRDRYRAFTVDEYQDVNLLQQTLLECWLGERDDLCVVGDDYQAIYSFTGASPRFLLDVPRRFLQATVVRLETNYRSSPEVLELANRLVPRLGGAPKRLRAALEPGPTPELRPFASPDAEQSAIVAQTRTLNEAGVPLEEVAILARTNARLADYEEALHAAEIPFQGASLLGREAARGLLRRIRRSAAASGEVRRAALELGWVDPAPDGLGEREQTRQADLARLVSLADSWEDATPTAGEFAEELQRRFGNGSSARRGVHLLTMHGAKGLEWDAVFLPRLDDTELPCRQARSEAQRDEERRLLYVAITRARRHLLLSWTRRPSPFLLELGLPPRTPTRPPEPDDPIYAALKRWRLDRAKADELPAYVVFHDSTLAEIAARSPRTLVELAAVPGVGPAKLERYGQALLAELASAAPTSQGS